jgi:hypothetical protein
MDDEDDIYSLFMAGQEDAPEAKGYADALAGSVAKNRGLGLIGQLTGDRILGKVGGSLLDIGKDKEGILAHAGQSRLMSAMAKAKSNAAAKQHGSDYTQKLRKEFMGLKAVENMSTLAESIQKIRGAGEDGAGDLGLIYGYMRALDPGSTVRESEFANAGKTGGLPGQVQGIFNQLNGDGMLAPQVRAKIRAEAEKLVQAQYERYAPVATEFKRYASQSGIAENDVVPDLGYEGYSRPAKQPKAAVGEAQGMPPRMLDKKNNWHVLGPDGLYYPEKKK